MEHPTCGWPPREIELDPSKRVLYLTRDLDLVRRQLYEGLDLRMADLRVEDLLDDVNTDVMTPAWVCFDHRPQAMAVHAYAGLVHRGERLFRPRALLDGNFQAIVSGKRKGTGSSRETAAQAERYAGIRLAVAASFAPIHARNNINLGQLMCDHAMLVRLEAGERVPLEAFTEGLDPITRLIVEHGGLFVFARKVLAGAIAVPPSDTGSRAMTMAERILAAKLRHAHANGRHVRPGDAVLCNVDGGYSHDFTSAQVHEFLRAEFGDDYRVRNRDKLAAFEDHLVYADQVPRFAPYREAIERLRDMQRAFIAHTGVHDYSARDGVSPGICHQLARESLVDPGDFFLATDSHTCMGGGNNALAFGVGATEYAALAWSGFAVVRVPESIRFELSGALAPDCTAKDLILEILATFARRGDTLDRVLEFGGPGLASLSPDERATLCNMATECSARGAIVEGDAALARWLARHRAGETAETVAARFVRPDPGAVYDGGVHRIDLSAIRPMVAHPGDSDRGIPADPTNGVRVDELDEVAIDIAYGGSCTAGKVDDIGYYAAVCRDAVQAGRRVASGVAFYIQFGSRTVREHAAAQGWLELFRRAGARIIEPGCGACVGCGPGSSTDPAQVTVSAINRNYQGRSGPGRVYLASPLTVAASAFAGRIVAYRPPASAGTGRTSRPGD